MSVLRTQKTNEQEKLNVIRQHAEMLREIHPCLPAYFCGNGYRIYPIPIGENAEDLIKKHGVVKFDPEGHVDTDVLAVIYDLFEYEEGKILFNPYIPFVTAKILRREFRNPFSALSQAFSRVYGEGNSLS